MREMHYRHVDYQHRPNFVTMKHEYQAQCGEWVTASKVHSMNQDPITCTACLLLEFQRNAEDA